MPDVRRRRIQDIVKRNYLRRAVGLLVAALPFALCAFSALSTPRFSASYIGWGLIGFGLFVAAMNLYLSFVRPALHRFRHGSLQHYHHSSGIPLVGTVSTFLGVAVAFGHPTGAALGALQFLADTGGLTWFTFSTWHDASLWDR
jgi:hypothetical protein